MVVYIKDLPGWIPRNFLKPVMNNNMMRLSDRASRTTILLTFILFAVALFLKGFTHDLLLEAGVFLVSIKLILMSHRQDARGEAMERTLNEINETLRRMQSKSQVP